MFPPGVVRGGANLASRDVMVGGRKYPAESGCLARTPMQAARQIRKRRRKTLSARGLVTVGSKDDSSRVCSPFVAVEMFGPR